jgi:exo-1,4-beta-D-glucosaminidase
MTKRNALASLLLFIFLSMLFSGYTKPEKKTDFRTVALSSGWKMQPGNKLSGTEEKLISEGNYDVRNWYNAMVPGTVLGALATNGVIEDPTYGINMQNVDTVQFKFNQPWWYRTTFKLSGNDLEKNISLRFNGICYRADLWVNGNKVVTACSRLISTRISGKVKIQLQ